MGCFLLSLSYRLNNNGCINLNKSKADCQFSLSGEEYQLPKPYLGRVQSVKLKHVCGTPPVSKTCSIQKLL